MSKLTAGVILALVLLVIWFFVHDYHHWKQIAKLQQDLRDLGLGASEPRRGAVHAVPATDTSVVSGMYGPWQRGFKVGDKVDVAPVIQRLVIDLPVIEVSIPKPESGCYFVRITPEGGMHSGQVKVCI